MTRNRLLYLRCVRASILTFALAVLQVLRTLTSWSIRPEYRSMRPLRPAALRGLVDFMLGRFGPPPAYI
jgi:hypothetical protein